jgi:8-oxo-dGTP diphosphatase
MSKNNTHILTRALIIDQGHILVCKSLNLPNNFYYLPGGHVEQGESVTEALKREMLEEAGSNIKIGRFLGCLENIFAHSDTCTCHNQEYSFIFEVQADKLKFNIPLTQQEAHHEIMWLPLEQLTTVHFKPNAMQELIPKWLACDVDRAFVSIKLTNH